MIAFDAAAFLAARAAMSAFSAPLTVSGGSTGFTRAVGPLAMPGAPASLVFPVVLFIALVLTGAYARQRAFVGLRVLAASFAATIAATVTLATLVGVRDALIHASSFGLVCFVALAAGRALGQTFMQLVWPRNRGSLAAVRASAPRESRLPESPTWGDYQVIQEVRIEHLNGASHIEETMQMLHDLGLRGVEALIITEELPEDVLVPLVHGALDLGYRVIHPARALPTEGVRPRLIWHQGEPFFEMSTPTLRASAVLVKRITDLLGASALLLLAAPIMGLIAIAIKLDSKGPVFFRQGRAGMGGRRFQMLKFRTMYDGADEMKKELSHLNRSGDVRLFKIPSDPRVTPIGKVLRRWSLDELPQLLNVLNGEMSLVGPRPFFEADFSEYEDRHFRRLDTKPGITGLWQVSGRSDVVEFDDVVFLDRQYIEQWSLWLDLSILIRTIPAVLRRDGAY